MEEEYEVSVKHKKEKKVEEKTLKHNLKSKT